jgi:hypothetical protein
MVKVIAPLMSMEAHGQFGQTLIYAKKGQTCYSKRYKAPINPRSQGQLVQRAAITGITRGWGYAKIWLGMDEPVFPLTDEIGLYHAYLKENLHNWQKGLPPIPIYTPYIDYDEPFENATYTKNGREYTITITQEGSDPTSFSHQYTASKTPGGSTDKIDTIRVFAFSEDPEPNWNDSFTWEAPDDDPYYFQVRRACVYGELCQWQEITEAA